MVKHVASRTTGPAQPGDVAACMRTLNHTVGELARCYGTAAVVAALTEMMGCSSCVTHTVDRASNILARVQRIERDR